MKPVKKGKKAVKAQKPMTKPETKPQPPKQKPPIKKPAPPKPADKPTKKKTTPVKMVKSTPHVEWGERNAKGGIVLKGVGDSGNHYHIKLNRGNRTWSVIHVSMKKKVTGLPTLDAAQMRALKWEKKSIPPKVPVTPPAPVKEPQLDGEPKKLGCVPRERQWEGKVPVWSLARYCHVKEGNLLLTGGVEVSFPPPKSTPQACLKWIEAVFDQYEELGMWVTTSALKSWLMQLRSNSVMQQSMTQGERDQFQRVLSDVIRNRTEPVEYSDRVRVQAIIESWQNEQTPEPEETEMKTNKTNSSKTNGNGNGSTVHERTEKKTVNVKGKKVNVTADVGVSEGGNKRFTILGLPMSAVLRWMGANGWKGSDARAVMDGLGLTEVKQSTINVKLYNGKGGGAGGEIPNLTREQVLALNKLRDDNKGKKATPGPTPKVDKVKKGKKTNKKTDPEPKKSKTPKTNGKKSKAPVKSKGKKKSKEIPF